ncbi:MAG: hypothetical protein GAK30_02077 [Paracidovorax wautersii]|uniref:Uncharacterized protein n=1 Tax=Paracidovorax wautersii TaxID=1177982 RepID=A0A7V8FNN4_9BURK|nr:MAG: hypothetical protein GAK30_02077 [Paracidovorax wautersii]
MSNLLSNQRSQTTYDITASWVGASEDKLVTAWGVPQGSYELSGGSKIISYRYIWNISSNVRQERWYDYSKDDRECVQKFLIENGIVTKWGASPTCKKVPDPTKSISNDIPIPRPTLQ